MLCAVPVCGRLLLLSCFGRGSVSRRISCIKVLMRKVVIIIAWSIFGLLVLLTTLGYFGIREGWIGYMPPLDELQSPINKYASQVYTADGKVIGTWSRNENRVFVDYDSISPTCSMRWLPRRMCVFMNIPASISAPWGVPLSSAACCVMPRPAAAAP